MGHLPWISSFAGFDEFVFFICFFFHFGRVLRFRHYFRNIRSFFSFKSCNPLFGKRILPGLSVRSEWFVY